MTDKKTRTPRNFDSILKGAKALPLKERVDLVNALTTENESEVELLQEQAQAASALLRQENVSIRKADPSS